MLDWPPARLLRFSQESTRSEFWSATLWHVRISCNSSQVSCRRCVFCAISIPITYIGDSAGYSFHAFIMKVPICQGAENCRRYPSRKGRLFASGVSVDLRISLPWVRRVCCWLNLVQHPEQDPLASCSFWTSLRNHLDNRRGEKFARYIAYKSHRKPSRGSGALFCFLSGQCWTKIFCTGTNFGPTVTPGLRLLALFAP